MIGEMGHVRLVEWRVIVMRGQHKGASDGELRQDFWISADQKETNPTVWLSHWNVFGSGGTLVSVHVMVEHLWENGEIFCVENNSSTNYRYHIIIISMCVKYDHKSCILHYR